MNLKNAREIAELRRHLKKRMYPYSGQSFELIAEAAIVLDDRIAELEKQRDALVATIKYVLDCDMADQPFEAERLRKVIGEAEEKRKAE